MCGTEIVWPSVSKAKNSAGTSSNSSDKVKKGTEERIRLQLVQMLHDGGSSMCKDTSQTTG